MIGASAGGVEALQRVVAGLPEDLGAPVLIVLHIPAFSASNLPAILSRAGPLEAHHAVDHEPLEPDRIYVAPPDRHLLVTRAAVRVVRGPHENNARPAIDPLFRSAALAFGPEAIGVVLTGTMDDGAAGVRALAARGGTVLVQDPEDALYPAMPINAIAAEDPEYVAPVAEIAGLVCRLVREPVTTTNESEEDQMDEELRLEQSFAAFAPGTINENGTTGRPAPFGCPTCGGSLWEVPDDAMLRFRCRVGHAFGGETLMEAQAEQMDEALWTALRAMEERGSLARRLAERMRTDHPRRANRFAASAEEADRHAKVLRRLLLAAEVPQV